MPTPGQIDRCFAKPVIPVLWDMAGNERLLAHASCVILQGGEVAKLSDVVAKFSRPPLDHLRVLVHIDLIAGLEANEAGLEMLTQVGDIDGVVSIHQHLTKPAKRLGMLSVLRVFLSDSRALERGLGLVKKSRPDVLEVLPAAAAVKVADRLRPLNIPHIAGGLCQTEADVQETIGSGCMAVTSTHPALWRLNE